MSEFSLSNNKGFFITFKNGYKVSCQWGIGTHSENFMSHLKEIKNNVTNVECAVIGLRGCLISLKNSPLGIEDEVAHHLTADDVLLLMNWAASL